jgi:hypothetical protein
VRRPARCISLVELVADRRVGAELEQQVDRLLLARLRSDVQDVYANFDIPERVLEAAAA